MRNYPKVNAAREAIEHNPELSSSAIARMVMKTHPGLFKDFDDARQTVRYARGAKEGKPGYRTPNPLPNSKSKGWGGLPPGMTTLEEWQPHVIENPGRVFIAGDLHIPYHDRNAIVTAMAFAKKFKPNTIILNGDVSDFYSVSFWQNDPSKRNLPLELVTVQEFLAALRSNFRKARIIYKLGNHEERWERYIRVKAPELYKVKVFQIGELLGLKKHGIELVDQKKPMRAGDLNIIHGHEYRFAISNPVSPARGLFLRGRAYAICNHFHQISHQTGRSIEDKVIACWSIGCLCDLHPEYAPFNEWQHGIATAEVADNGKFNLENRKISHGKLY